MRGVALALAGVLAAALAGCAPETRVTRGGGVRIAEAQAEPVHGGKPRIAIGAIIDKTDPGAEGSLARELARLNAWRDGGPQLDIAGLTGGIRDLLTTELFGSGRFIVVEREGLGTLLAEQEFSQSARAGDATRIPLGELEGAELLVVGAITAFDAGVGGGALPLPIPLSRRGDFGILHIGAKRGHVAMDLRVVDCRSGRVLNATAVEGSHWRLALDFTGFFSTGHDHIKLPGLLRYFQNTPVEQALQRMVTAAVERITLTPAAP